MRDWPTFCVVRHPYERWLSLFRHEAHYVKSGEYLWKDFFNTTEERKAAGKDFETAMLLNVTVFTKWADRRLSQLENLARLAQGNEEQRCASPLPDLATLRARRRRFFMNKYYTRTCHRNITDPLLWCVMDDCHSLPQVASVFYADGARSCTHVVRYDRLADELKRLKAAYGPGAFGRRDYECAFRSHAGNKSAEKNREFVGIDEERLHFQQIPERLRERLRVLYAADFEAFNFCS